MGLKFECIHNELKILECIHCNKKRMGLKFECIQNELKIFECIHAPLKVNWIKIWMHSSFIKNALNLLVECAALLL